MARYSTGSDEDREQAVEAAATAISKGELVVLPTDTVYCIAADAFDKDSVARLLAAKGRGRDMPPPVLISSPLTADGLARELSQAARVLMEKFWPGPLTVVAHQQRSLQWDLGDTRGTVAIRMPDHEVALAILERTGPLAVSSANTTGQPAATSVQAAEHMLSAEVEVFVDGGETPGAEASTIIDATVDPPRVLRHGALSVETLNEALAELDVTLADED